MGRSNSGRPKWDVFGLEFLLSFLDARVDESSSPEWSWVNAHVTNHTPVFPPTPTPNYVMTHTWVIFSKSTTRPQCNSEFTTFLGLRVTHFSNNNLLFYQSVKFGIFLTLLPWFLSPRIKMPRTKTGFGVSESEKLVFSHQNRKIEANSFNCHSLSKFVSDLS